MFSKIKQFFPIIILLAVIIFVQLQIHSLKKDYENKISYITNTVDNLQHINNEKWNEVNKTIHNTTESISNNNNLISKNCISIKDIGEQNIIIIETISKNNQRIEKVTKMSLNREKELQTLRELIIKMFDLNNLGG